MNNMSYEGVPQDTLVASTIVEWSALEHKMLAEIKDVHGIRRCADALRVSAQDMDDLANEIGNSVAEIWTEEDGTIFVSASADLIRRLVAEGLLFFPNDDDGSSASASVAEAS